MSESACFKRRGTILEELLSEPNFKFPDLDAADDCTLNQLETSSHHPCYCPSTRDGSWNIISRSPAGVWDYKPTATGLQPAAALMVALLSTIGGYPSIPPPLPYSLHVSDAPSWPPYPQQQYLQHQLQL